VEKEDSAFKIRHQKMGSFTGVLCWVTGVVYSVTGVLCSEDFALTVT
jgi:hypothetical protein